MLLIYSHYKFFRLLNNIRCPRGQHGHTSSHISHFCYFLALENSTHLIFDILNMAVRSATRVPLSCCAMSYCIFLCINVGSSWCCGEGCPCLRNSVRFVGAVAAGKYFNSTNNILKSPPCRGSSTRPDMYEPAILTLWSRASINYSELMPVLEKGDNKNPYSGVQRV